MFLSVGHLKMFKPDRKAFFKNLPWKKKIIRNTPVFYMVWRWEMSP